MKSSPRTSHRRNILLCTRKNGAGAGFSVVHFIGDQRNQNTMRVVRANCGWHKSSVATEAETRFLVYGAELVEVVDFIHIVLKIIHRDLRGGYQPLGFAAPTGVPKVLQGVKQARADPIRRRTK